MGKQEHKRWYWHMKDARHEAPGAHEQQKYIRYESTQSTRHVGHKAQETRKHVGHKAHEARGNVYHEAREAREH